MAQRVQTLALANPADFRMRKEELQAIGEEVTAYLQKAGHRQASAARSAARLGDAPPINNMGGKGEEREWHKLVLDNGEVKMVPVRRGWGGSSAFIDWVNCTFHETTFHDGPEGIPLSDADVIREVSRVCSEVFGFGITSQRETGANFYRTSYVLGDAYGMVCYGGQRNTVLIMLNGEGCTASAPGWEKRLFDFLDSSLGGRITRVDLAHDVFAGETYNVDKALADYESSRYEDGVSYGFCSGGRIPDCEQRGNWKRPNGKGRTFYVGHRINGKFARIYEKGRQLGCPESEWVRIEGEMKSVDRIIPYDVLLQPGQYLAAMYPAFGWISAHQERILTTQKTTEIKYDRALNWLKRQCGAFLYVAQQVEGGAENLLNKIIREEWPKRLKVPDYRFANAVGPFFHQLPKPRILREAAY